MVGSRVAFTHTTMHPAPPRLLFAGTIFSSAFCLFLIQPIIAKQILPWFGGSAAVWAVCLVFFQLMLLAGYAYSDWSSRHLRPALQVGLHVLLLAASVLFLPIIAGNGWKPVNGDDPTWRIIALLLATVGLPYFMLSTTGPLVQSWVARSFDKAQVYRYFSLSNLASLIALISYPFLIERHWAIAGQAYGWSAGYSVFALLCAGCALVFLRAQRQGAPASLAAQDASPEAKSATDVAARGAAPTLRSACIWLIAAAMGSWMLLAVTSHITQNVAAIPFLWLLPLTLYLLTFVLCFESDRWYRPNWFRPLTALLMAVCAYSLAYGSLGSNVLTAVPLFVGCLFLLCMFYHGELARLRPSPQYLTRFYLMLSLGGALGGIGVGLIAPHVLPAYYELGIGFVVTALLAAVLVQARWQRVLALALGVFCSVFLLLQIQDDVHDSRYLGRNFYGTLSTFDSHRSDPLLDRRQLYHGAIKHGEQFLEPTRKSWPTAYYGQTSGVALAIAQTQHPGQRVGVIGLGAGTLATYGRAGDSYRMYELNPDVIQVAQTEFSFLADSAAHIDLIPGDARLSLEREAPQNYDVLAVDAFSGDAIPVHLITDQAMAVYLRHLQPDGVIAFHLTNRYLNLAPVVQAIAQSRGLHSVLVHDEPERPAQRDTDWMLVSRNAAVLESAAISARRVEPAHIAQLGVWSDDFNNLFDVLR